jgi:hypothetical protein
LSISVLDSQIAVINERQSVVELYTFDGTTLTKSRDLDVGAECFSVQFTAGKQGALLWVVSGQSKHLRVYALNSGTEVTASEELALDNINKEIEFTVASEDNMYPSHIRHDVRTRDNKHKKDDDERAPKKSKTDK